MSIERRYPLLKHDHDAADITSGVFAPSLLGSGTADSSKFLRGDSTWSDTLVGRLTLNPATDEALRLRSTNAYVSFYDPTGSTRYGYIQSHPAANSMHINAEQLANLRLYASGTNILTLTTAGANLHQGIMSVDNGYVYVRPTTGTTAMRLIARTDTSADATWIQWYRANGTTERGYIGFGSNGSDALTLMAQVGELQLISNGSLLRTFINGNEVMRNNADGAHSRYIIRATGWYGSQGTHNGPGAEMGYSGGRAYFIGYDRCAGAYTPVEIDMSNDFSVYAGNAADYIFRMGNGATSAGDRAAQFKGSTNSGALFNWGANQDVYIRPGTTSGLVYIGYAGVGNDTVEIRRTDQSPNVRIRSVSSSLWSLEIYREDYGAGSKVFVHRYDGVNMGWHFEHMPYIYGARSPNGVGRMLLPGTNGSGVNQETHFYSNVAGSSAIRTIDSGNTSGAWLYAAGSDFGLLDHGGNWALRWNNASSWWDASKGNCEFAANGYRWRANANFYIYNPSGYTYGSWRIAGTNGGYVGLILDIGKQWTFMSDGTAVGVYGQNGGSWAWYHDGAGSGGGTTRLYNTAGTAYVAILPEASSWCNFNLVSSNKFYFGAETHVNGKLVRYLQGAHTHYGSSSFQSGVITVQSGGSASGGSDGDIYLIY